MITKMEPEQKLQVERDWSRIAGEPVTVELIDISFYAYCATELGALRLFKAFCKGRDFVDAKYSKNLQTWYFVKDQAP